MRETESLDLPHLSLTTLIFQKSLVHKKPF
jgi:hypothetical protein